MRILGVLFVGAFCLGAEAKVVLRCEGIDSKQPVRVLEVELSGDKLDAYLTLPARPERIRYDVKVWEQPSGYSGQYFQLTVDEWDHVVTPAELAVEYPVPMLDSAFHPNLKSSFNCSWQ